MRAPNGSGAITSGMAMIEAYPRLSASARHGMSRGSVAMFFTTFV